MLRPALLLFRLWFEFLIRAWKVTGTFEKWIPGSGPRKQNLWLSHLLLASYKCFMLASFDQYVRHLPSTDEEKHCAVRYSNPSVKQLTWHLPILFLASFAVINRSLNCIVEYVMWLWPPWPYGTPGPHAYVFFFSMASMGRRMALLDRVLFFQVKTI